MAAHLSNIKVAVIGGGLAGLTSASELSSHGINVTVFEAAPQIGGRARRVYWKGLALDNGQHILLGAYHQTLKLMKKIGLNEKASLLRQPLNLNILNALHLQSFKFLPAPFNLLIALLLCKGLSFSERYAAMRFFVALKRMNFKIEKDIPLNQLLKDFNQSESLIKYLWEPLCLAALNTPISSASAQIYLNILRDSFNQKKNDSDLLLPKIDLSGLLAEPLANFVQSHHGEIKLNSEVKGIEKSNDTFLVNGLNFSHIILAVSPSRVAQIIAPLGKIAAIEQVNKFSYEPIYTIYLQYPSDVKLPQVMTGLMQTMSQWVFDRGQLNGQKGLIAVIISAKGKHQKLSQEALAHQVINELHYAFPELPTPEWHKVIAEKRATFSCVAHLERPQQKTSIQNFYLAGDYTEGDYPATIEGAIQSGLSAAQLILQS